MKPYTYYLYHTLTGMKYYGARFAKNCKPEDLWTTYFSSSRRVKNLLQKYGKDTFVVEVRKIFDSANECIRWETEVLQRLNVAKRTDWLNQHNGDGKFLFKGGPAYKCSEEKKEKIRKGNQGKHLSEETRKKIGKAHLGKSSHRKGKKMSEETKKKMAISKLGNLNPNFGKITREETKKKIKEGQEQNRCAKFTENILN